MADIAGEKVPAYIQGSIATLNLVEYKQDKESHMNRYQRLSFREREELSRYLSIGLGYRQIARLTNRFPSTIYREILRNGPTRSRYRAIDAQKRARRAAKKPRRVRKLDANQKLQKTVIKYFKLRWSPEQIAKRLKILYPNDITMHISHETIYAYLYIHPRQHLKRQLVLQLRRSHKERRVKNKALRRSSPIQDYISIDDRPPEVNARKIAGHWEGDLIKRKRCQAPFGAVLMWRSATTANISRRFRF